MDMYAGKFVDQEEAGNAATELICLEEYTPPNVILLPDYIASLERYTEKECRRLCRQIAEIIKLSHESGMAHRNLQLNNFFVDRSVRIQIFPCLFGCLFVYFESGSLAGSKIILSSFYSSLANLSSVCFAA